MTRGRPLLVRIAALATLGSGLVNLVSLVGPTLPERRRLLEAFFPLEFLNLSRFLTLVVGFALIIASINIYKRKRRAFQAVFALACLSAMFHLTKGLDYEEAASSLVLIGLLFFARHNFTVKSSAPNMKDGLIRFGLALLIALGNGIAGFWYLDPREFGINFTLGDAIHETWLYLILVGDPGLVPHTRHAAWFLDSIYLMTVVSVGYAAFAVFRPVLYQLQTLPREQALARSLAAQYGRSALDYFKSWPDKSLFFPPSQRCFLSYSVSGGFALVLGDPVGPENEIEESIRAFMALCDANDWDVGFYETLPDYLEIYKRFGFRKLKIGDDAIADLTRLTLEGKRMKEFRNKITQLEKLGIHTASFSPPIADEVLVDVKEVSDEWLQIPGRRERSFTLGRFTPEYIRSTPLFAVANQKGRILAFANIIPAYRPKETTVDLMRHRMDVPNGTMDYLFIKLLYHERDRGFERFNFGMAPMAGFQEREQASPEERAIHFFFQRMNFLFSYRGIRNYKAKFATFWEPRYAIYRRTLDLPRLAITLSKVSTLESGEE